MKDLIKEHNKKMKAMNKRKDKKLMALGKTNYPISKTKEN